MYESYFRLSHRPFAAAPSPDVYISTGSLEQARQTLVRCLERAEGPGLLVGPAGTGKSLLCQVLAKHFRPRFQIAHLDGARLGTRRALLQNILFELKLPYRSMDESELRLSLIDHLEPRSGGVDGMLLLVDEAHMLPLRLLEEVRLLTNVIRDGQSRVRLLLSGGMALEERLANPKLESFHQRLAARCYLQPLGRDEAIYYLHEQIRRCGGNADQLFTGDAQAAVHTASDGIPRLINQTCDHALMLAVVNGRQQVDAAGIEEAWADLQQLPVPLHDPPVLADLGSGSAGGSIEFGQLADESAAVAGIIGPDLANAAVANLEVISRTLDSLHEPQFAAGMITGTVADDFSPPVTGGTEVELYFHGAHDPFGGHWEEEEVVIDRYASLEDAAVRSRRVTSEEGRALGAAVTAAVDSAHRFVPNEATAEGQISLSPVSDSVVTISAGPAFDPASDPLMPEETPAATKRTAVSLRAIAQDDRDMIIVEEDTTRERAPLTGRPKRTEYRRLFSSLRSK